MTNPTLETAARVAEEEAREVLADAYERANYPDEAAAFRAGTWTCHDHPAFEAMLTFAARASSERERRLVEALGDIFNHFADREQAPGHSHLVPGIWDRDIGNGEKGGTGCEWCAKWERARAALGGTDAE